MGCAVFGRAADYPWVSAFAARDRLAARVAAPRGFVRTAAPVGSFAAWLRGLPLRPGCLPVHLYDGTRKGNQQAHAAVLHLDVGQADLQQCADAVMRLRAEYLYSRGDYAKIHFNFTNGTRVDFSAWARGLRPVIRGNRVTWASRARPDYGYATFRAYLTTVFTYAGTASLARELAPVAVADIQPGDVFIHGGAPGHAVIVLDVATHPRTRQTRFLLAQSYMPAQEMHLLKNPSDPRLSPWYPADFGPMLITPEWTFQATELKRWR
jgi:hypothetical protein